MFLFGRLLLPSQFEFLDHPLQLLDAILPVLRHLAHVQGSQLVEGRDALRSLMCYRLRRHPKPHVLGPVDEFQNRTGGLVVLLGLDAEDSRVSTWAVGVALPERSEELGDELVRGLTGVEEVC